MGQTKDIVELATIGGILYFGSTLISKIFPKDSPTGNVLSDAGYNLGNALPVGTWLANLFPAQPVMTDAQKKIIDLQNAVTTATGNSKYQALIALRQAQLADALATGAPADVIQTRREQLASAMSYFNFGGGTTGGYGATGAW